MSQHTIDSPPTPTSSSTSGTDTKPDSPPPRGVVLPIKAIPGEHPASDDLFFMTASFLGKTVHPPALCFLLQLFVLYY